MGLAAFRKTYVFLVLATLVIFIFCVICTSNKSSSSDEIKSESNPPPILCVNESEVSRDIQERYEQALTVSFQENSHALNISDERRKLAQRLSNISAIVKVPEVDCAGIFHGSVNTANITSRLAEKLSFLPICDYMYTSLTSNCKKFISFRGYTMSSLTKEEEEFPLAFSLLVYKDAEMVERLLRAIYRPQNYYCIHVDASSPDSFFRAISYIANCFTNVFIASRRIDVQWGMYSVLEPELLCMEELWRYPSWKYFFTLTGQEFPLKTNHELVKILKAYNGANDIETTIKNATKTRWKNTVPPLGIRAAKGSVHIVANRHYVDYVLHHATARALLNWTKTTEIPDETFFATLNANPQLGIPGTYKGEPEMNDTTRPFLARYKHWEPTACAGRYVRDICILSTGDLPALYQGPQLFANKFFLSEDRVVIGCLEEKIFNDTLAEFIGSKVFDTSYYSTLDFVTNQVH